MNDARVEVVDVYLIVNKVLQCLNKINPAQGLKIGEMTKWRLN